MIGPEATGGEWAAGIFTVLGLLVLVAVIGEFVYDPLCDRWCRWRQRRRDAPQNRCMVPPPGWRCTRGADHDGPCAAVEVDGG